MSGLDSFEKKMRTDIVSLIRTKLTQLGHETDSKDEADLLTDYYTIKFKRIQRRKRLITLHPLAICPPKFLKGFQSFCQHSKNGDDLNPYLSKQARDIKKNDGLLFDFGIHHIHLGENIGPDNFIERTDPVAYILIKGDHIYVIGFYSHREFGSKEVLERVHHAWPNLIAPFRIPNTHLSQPTPENRSRLRKNGFNTLIELPDGSVYMPPGLGFTSENTSNMAETLVSQATRQIDRVIDELSDLRRELSNRLPTGHHVTFEFTLHTDQHPYRITESRTRECQALTETIFFDFLY